MKRKSLILGLAILLFLVILSIASVTNAATELTYSDTEQGIEWGYELAESGNIVNLRCKTASVTGTVTIPSTIDGKTVISLYKAFKNCAGLTGITIPNTITTIDGYAFTNCTGLKTITIPDSVTQIGDSAFYGCSGLTSVTLSKNLTKIGEYAFENCTGLKTITIPDSVTQIERRAFYKCSGLTSVTLSKNLTKIDENTFGKCSGLSSVKLPDSVTTIYGYGITTGAFYECTNLKKVLIPDTVASIGNSAFEYCSKLTIYGNDGMTSKEYAEEHKIPFEYIANWDKASSGSDITAPTVKSIIVTYASVMSYPKDSNRNMYMVPSKAKLTINVNFSETIEGTAVPTLTVKFGSGENIKVTEGTIAGSTITYIYTIKDTDKGVMSTVSLAGGNIKDEAGNAATLSCPALTVQYNSNEFVYANGTATKPNTGNNNGTGSGTNSGSSNSGSNTGSGNSNNGGTTTNKKDPTTASGKLPQTGLSYTIAIVIIAVLGIGVITLKKCRSLRDI